MIEHEFFDNGEKITEQEWLNRYGELPTFPPEDATEQDYQKALTDLGVNM